jgi:hypothetical protein
MRESQTIISLLSVGSTFHTTVIDTVPIRTDKAPQRFSQDRSTGPTIGHWTDDRLGSEFARPPLFPSPSMYMLTPWTIKGGRRTFRKASTLASITARRIHTHTHTHTHARNPETWDPSSLSRPFVTPTVDIEYKSTRARTRRRDIPPEPV